MYGHVIQCNAMHSVVVYSTVLHFDPIGRYRLVVIVW